MAAAHLAVGIGRGRLQLVSVSRAAKHFRHLLTLQVAIGALSILPFYLWERAHTGDFILSWQSAGALAYVAVFPSVLAYYCWEKGVAKLGVQLAGQFVNLTPIFGAILAVLLLGEHFHWHHAAGMALLVGGLWLSNRYRA